MKIPPISYRVAWAAGHTVANRRMRRAGRTKWNVADYNAACRTFNLLMGLK